MRTVQSQPFGRICLRTFCWNVFVHEPCVPSYSKISRTMRPFTSSPRPLAFTSFASLTPSNVDGNWGFGAAADFAG